MIENALLLVTRPGLMPIRIGGMTVLERQLHTAARAGLKRIWVGRRPADLRLEALRLPAGLEVLWSARESDCEPPYVTLSADHFMRVETLGWALSAGYREAATLRDGGGLSVIGVVPYRSERFEEAPAVPLPRGASVYLELPADREPVLSWLMATATKPTDGFMARHFDRRISLAISRLLLETPVSPNALTLLSTAIGLAGALCFLEPARQLLGAWLIWLHSVVDGCDGELARMRFQQSRFGAALDFWGDNAVHVALWCCMALGLSRALASPAPLLAGALATFGTVGSAALAFRMKSTVAARGALADAAEALAQRDFIYLLLLVAYLGWTHAFLWLSGIGSVFYFLTMLHLGRHSHEQAEPRTAH